MSNRCTSESFTRAGACQMRTGHWIAQIQGTLRRPIQTRRSRSNTTGLEAFFYGFMAFRRMWARSFVNTIFGHAQTAQVHDHALLDTPIDGKKFVLS